MRRVAKITLHVVVDEEARGLLRAGHIYHNTQTLQQMLADRLYDATHLRGEIRIEAEWDVKGIEE